MTQLFKVTKVRFHACIHDYEYLCDWIKVYVSGRSWGLEKAHHLVSVVPISDINFIHNKVLFARSPMLTSTRCTISYQTHKKNMLSLDDIMLNGNNTYARPRRIFVVVTVVLYPLFFEGLDVVIWLHTIHLSFYYITNLMIHFTKNTFYRKMIHTCWKYEFPELIEFISFECHDIFHLVENGFLTKYVKWCLDITTQNNQYGNK